MLADLQHGKWGGPYQSERVEVAERPLEWQTRGLSYTASGYGKKIPTSYVIKRAGDHRWRRVYCTVYSNNGTCWANVAGVSTVVHIWRD